MEPAEYEKQKKKGKVPAWVWGVVGVSVAVLPAVWLTLNVISTQVVSCEVCVQFGGGSKCRTATADTKEECQRTATDNACAFLASGMTQIIACTTSMPASVKYKN